MTNSQLNEPSMNPIDPTAVLLRDSNWRIRVVEKITPLTKDHYELRRSYQFRMPIDSFGPFMTESGTVDTFLPVCWLDKQPLLEFDASDQAGRPLSVVERLSNAGIISSILGNRLADLAPDITLADPTFLETVCYTSLAPWQQAIDRSTSHDDALALYQYYRDLLDITLPPFKCGELISEAQRVISDVLEAAQVEPDNRAFMSTLNPLIVAPFTGEVESREELLAEISRIVVQVEAIAEIAAMSGEAATWVRLLYRSSRQWPVLTRTVVRPGSEHLVKIREVRPSGHASPAIVIHRADLAGAMSYHLEVRAPDPSIRLHSQPRIEDLEGNELGSPGAFDTAKWTNELFSAYSTVIDRPERPTTATVSMRFGLYPTTWVPELFGLLLNALALAFALLYRDSMSISLATLLLIPTTVVTAFLAIRDSALVADLLQRLKWGQLSMNVLLWVTVMMLLQIPPVGK